MGLEILRRHTFSPFASQFILPMSHPQESAYLLVGLLRRMNYQDLQVLELDSPELLSTRLWVELFGSPPLLAITCIPQGERDFFSALIGETGNIAVHPDHTSLPSVGSAQATLPFRALEGIKVLESGFDVHLGRILLENFCCLANHIFHNSLCGENLIDERSYAAQQPCPAAIDFSGCFSRSYSTGTIPLEVNSLISACLLSSL
jgi:hypothetical protein